MNTRPSQSRGRRLADLVETVDMSPGERARARARIEQMEPVVNAIAAAEVWLRERIVHLATRLCTFAERGHARPRKPVHP